MDTTVVDEFLEHYGKKGMRWGVSTKKKPVPQSRDFKTATDLRKRPIPSLSNKQLQTANNRANLETSFRRMNPTTITKGKHVVEAIVATGILVESVYKLSKNPAFKAIMDRGKKSAYTQLKLPL